MTTQSPMADESRNDGRTGERPGSPLGHPPIDRATAGTGWTDEARHRLLGLRQAPGAWGYRARSSPAAEPSCLAALALRDGPAPEDRAASIATARRLASIRRPDGSLAESAELPEAGWPTPFGLLLWSALGGFEAERSAAVAWLLALRGETATRIKDDPMGHDASIVGWPWVSGTHSWVEPTAIALLALAREGMGDHPRSLEGVRLLLDRAIPTGGWNLGNPVVFGTPLRPLPGPTGLALLALATFGGRPPVVDPAIAYLRSSLAGTLAPISLGWGLLGLRAWKAEPPEAPAWLASASSKHMQREPRSVELAMLLLASGTRSLGLLGLAGHGSEASSSPLPEGQGGGGIGLRPFANTEVSDHA